eukprot:CAMPEP_0117045286 /NCGR_PEP_ID=MMETSP0472-20121206/31329_1 /TAXON_ID=693140 ORGANISM="Tiarina fusus, Strain LIS" /NCGR_SAMPLE_ID=MMETSP0472 /ASSEMBLY_ACC=CAM_ASM_000603 /LENGTH=192 /DNA_ID=CAMNT_0004757229 /DNA_START=73 /DNA_END=651 /DNA_ORIENTATION=+
MLASRRHLLALAGLFSLANSYVIGPGTGLRSKDSAVEVVIFEHTENGTGGLVLNCAAPLNIGSLNIPRFQAFQELPLMLGNGLDEDDDSGTSTVSLGEVSPWFWLHDLEDIPGSFVLEKASGPLYMGGDIEEATKRLQEEKIDPKGRFKFFRRYVSWQAGELEQALNDGKWVAAEQDPEKALKAVMPSFRLS